MESMKEYKIQTDLHDLNNSCEYLISILEEEIRHELWEVEEPKDESYFPSTFDLEDLNIQQIALWKYKFKISSESIIETLDKLIKHKENQNKEIFKQREQELMQ